MLSTGVLGKGLLFLAALLGCNKAQDILGCVITSFSCPNPDITFYLYNKTSPDSPYFLTEDNAAVAPIPPNAKVVVLIHGFTGDKDFAPNSMLRPTLLSLNYYVISVDYGPLARPPCYYQATRNLNTVGLCTARVVRQLIDSLRVQRDNVHIIGFSLGAHAAGATGKYFRQMGSSLPWITGLDPAGPLFDDTTTNSDFRLDPSDADFVDVVHTNCGIQGTTVSSGHVDFFMNNGVFQPGCNFDTRCDHDRAPIYYGESLTTTQGFWGYSYTFSPFLILVPGGGSFNNGNLLMGINVPHTARGMWRVDTNASPLFARGRN